MNIKSLGLQRNHYNMNKFGSASDAAYRSVKYAITEIASGNISINSRKNSLLREADALIRKKHYTTDRLRIERLSGDLTPMDQCYINLAIVEQPRENASLSKQDTVQQSSPFSLFARLKVEKPDASIEIALATLFNLRKAPDGKITQPSRILIRGRAGIRKTTLYKKMVHDFVYGKMWQDLFDHVLWVLLQNLKRKERRQVAGYNFGHLFRDEYLSQYPEGDALAKVL
jgi:hypothetical protein